MNDQIVIAGETIPTSTLAVLLQPGIFMAQMHAGESNQLVSAADDLSRAHQAAAFFSANACDVIGNQAMACLEAGDGVALQLALEINGLMHKHHKLFWAAFEACQNGQAPALPDDLEARRGVLRDNLSAAVAALEQVRATAAALPADSPKKVTAGLVLALLDKAAKGAAESVDCAFGVLNVEVSDEQLANLVADSMMQLTFVLGKSEEEARQMIEAKLGSTAEEQKKAVAAQVAAPLAIDTVGIGNGTLLSAEQEIAVLAHGVNLLVTALATA